MGRMLRLLAVGVVAAVWGCFSPPSADVLFSCDPDDAPACPPEYTCESDGCCHRNGSDVDASRGACNSVATSGALTGLSDTDPSETDPSETDTSGLDSSTDSSTGTDPGSSGSGTGTAGADTSGTDSGTGAG